MEEVERNKNCEDSRIELLRCFVNVLTINAMLRVQEDEGSISLDTANVFDIHNSCLEGVWHYYAGNMEEAAMLLSKCLRCAVCKTFPLFTKEQVRKVFRRKEDFDKTIEIVSREKGQPNFQPA